ncbi:MAG: hypothetical protein QXQ54_08045 [Thermoplasmata archaeon]
MRHMIKIYVKGTETRRTYVRFEFSSEGASPAEIIRIMTSLGFQIVQGHHDFMIDYHNDGEFLEITERLHRALRGTNVRYTLTTEPLKPVESPVDIESMI